MDGSLWGLLILLAMIGLFMYVRLSGAKGLVQLDSDGFKKELTQGRTVLLDVREPYEYKGGFIQGAVNMPLSQRV